MNLDIELIAKEYFVNKKSLHVIAQEWKTYPNRIRRLLQKNGYSLRNKSDAQKTALKLNRIQHPTKGKVASSETKEKISKKLTDVWSSLTPEDLEKRRKDAKVAWDKRTIKEKEEMLKKAHAGCRAAAKEGSRFEKILRGALIDAGYVAQYHHRGLLPNEKLEVDFYIPKLKLAIEIDGPSHFLPIWGEESLSRQQHSDKEKYGLLVASNIKVLRIKILKRFVTQRLEREFINKTMSYILSNKIADLMELEIN